MMSEVLRAVQTIDLKPTAPGADPPKALAGQEWLGRYSSSYSLSGNFVGHATSILNESDWCPVSITLARPSRCYLVGVVSASSRVFCCTAANESEVMRLKLQSKPPTGDHFLPLNSEVYPSAPTIARGATY